MTAGSWPRIRHHRDGFGLMGVRVAGRLGERVERMLSPCRGNCFSSSSAASPDPARKQSTRWKIASSGLRDFDRPDCIAAVRYGGFSAAVSMRPWSIAASCSRGESSAPRNDLPSTILPLRSRGLLDEAHHQPQIALLGAQSSINVYAPGCRGCTLRKTEYCKQASSAALTRLQSLRRAAEIAAAPSASMPMLTV